MTERRHWVAQHLGGARIEVVAYSDGLVNVGTTRERLRFDIKLLQQFIHVLKLAEREILEAEEGQAMTEILRLRDAVLEEPELSVDAEDDKLRIAVSDVKNENNEQAGFDHASIALSEEGVRVLIRHLNSWMKAQRRKSAPDAVRKAYEDIFKP